jgi:hypothetical protein
VVSARQIVKYHPLVKQATTLRDALLDATVILNPTHTRMGNGGTLKAKRRFLSRDRRIYLSASNWDTGAGQRISRTLHSLWFDGAEKQWCENCFDIEHFCYREWDLFE